MIATKETNLRSSHRKDGKSYKRMDIILWWSVADEEEGNANKMNERADHDLSNVQSEDSISKGLFGDG